MCATAIRLAALSSIAGSATSERDFRVFLDSETAFLPHKRSDAFTRRR
jgi:hypothetical protein